jgi:hypothetical protein
MVVSDDDHGRCVRDPSSTARRILGTGVPVDVGEDDPSVVDDEWPEIRQRQG